MYSAADNKIYLGTQTPEQMRPTILHELQHAIQSREGFARGGAPSEFIPKELFQAEKEFNKTKDETLNSLKKDRGLNDLQIEQLKFAVENEPYLSGEAANVLKDLKEKHPKVYRNLKNITEAERLIQEQKDIAWTKYNRLAGEAEARNVERRSHMGLMERMLNHPRSTESVPRFLQDVRLRK